MGIRIPPKPLVPPVDPIKPIHRDPPRKEPDQPPPKKKGLAAICLLLAACSTTETIPSVQTKDIQVKGRALDGVIGINGKDQIIIRQDNSAQDELIILDLTNTHLLDEVERDLHDLKLCRIDLSDPRLGGTGEFSDVPEIAKNAPEVESRFGRDENGDLRIVKEKSFLAQLKAEQEFEVTLKKLKKVVKNERDDCERKLDLARYSH